MLQLLHIKLQGQEEPPLKNGSAQRPLGMPAQDILQSPALHGIANDPSRYVVAFPRTGNPPPSMLNVLHSPPCWLALLSSWHLQPWDLNGMK